MMKTQILTKGQLNEAAQIIRNGGLVAMPTETVYGLAADALNGKAVAKIFKAKGRPMDNPLIVHIAEIEDLERLAAEFPEKARLLASRFWPGPLTMVLPKSELIPVEVSTGLDTVGIRFPAHPLAQELIREAAHRLRRPPPTVPESRAPPRRSMCCAIWTAVLRRCSTAGSAVSAWNRL